MRYDINGCPSSGPDEVLGDSAGPLFLLVILAIIIAVVGIAIAMN